MPKAALEKAAVRTGQAKDDVAHVRGSLSAAQLYRLHDRRALEEAHQSQTQSDRMPRKPSTRTTHGLEEVKERILEFLAVQQRVKKLKGPVLCLVGLPGVGKTSLGESIARPQGASLFA